MSVSDWLDDSFTDRDHDAACIHIPTRVDVIDPGWCQRIGRRSDQRGDLVSGFAQIICADSDGFGPAGRATWRVGGTETTDEEGRVELPPPDRRAVRMAATTSRPPATPERVQRPVRRLVTPCRRPLSLQLLRTKGRTGFAALRSALRNHSDPVAALHARRARRSDHRQHASRRHAKHSEVLSRGARQLTVARPSNVYANGLGSPFM